MEITEYKNRRLGRPNVTPRNSERLQNAKTERDLKFKDMKPYWDTEFQSELDRIELKVQKGGCLKILDTGHPFAFEFIADCDCQQLTQDLLILTSSGGYFWQHFIQDVWPFLIYCSKFLENNPHIWVVLFEPYFDSFIWLWKLSNIKNKIVYTSPGTIFKTTGNVFTLSIPRVNLGEYPVDLVKPGLKVFSQISNGKPDKFIYIVRKGNKRVIQNDTQLRTVLREYAEKLKLTFIAIDPSILCVQTRFDLFGQAAFIVAPHGGANYHIVFCQPGTIFLEICFGQCLHTFFWLATAREMKYWMYVCETAGHFSEKVNIDIEDFRQTLLAINTREFKSHHPPNNQ